MLLWRELVGMLRVDSGEVARTHVILYTINGTYATFIVYMFQQTAVLHLPFRTTMEYLGFFLELNDGNGFVHLSCQAHILFFHRVAFQEFGLEFLARVIAIDLHSEGGQRHQINAISLFNSRQIGISQ